MTSKNKGKSPKQKEKVYFEAPSRPSPSYELSKLHPVVLPGISTILPALKNPPLHLVPEKAVGIAYTRQQRTVHDIDTIDPEMISGSRANRKNPPGAVVLYSMQLRALAKSIGIDPMKMHKPELANLVRPQLAHMRSSLPKEDDE